MMKFGVLFIALILLAPIYVVAQEGNEWNETLTVPPTGTQIVLRHVN
jgi:hypothetical protein